MRVTRNRETTHDHAAVLDHQQQRVQVATQGLDEAPFLGNATPALGGEQERTGLAPHRLCEVDQPSRVSRLGLADADHGTTSP